MSLMLHPLSYRLCCQGVKAGKEEAESGEHLGNCPLGVTCPMQASREPSSGLGSGEEGGWPKAMEACAWEEGASPTVSPWEAPGLLPLRRQTQSHSAWSPNAPPFQAAPAPARSASTDQRQERPPASGAPKGTALGLNEAHSPSASVSSQAPKGEVPCGLHLRSADWMETEISALVCIVVSALTAPPHPPATAPKSYTSVGSLVLCSAQPVHPLRDSPDFGDSCLP